MTEEILKEFTAGWSCDSALAAAACHGGELLEAQELLELCAGARCLFNLATLACRELDRTEDCRRLWQKVLETFEQALAVWDGLESESARSYRQVL